MAENCFKENLSKISSEMDWQINTSSLGSRFKELLSLNQWTDCAFAVGDEVIEVINCHKLVLAVSSPVFEALFYGPLAETGQVITVPDIDPEAFRLMLNYMYCDSIEFLSIQEAGAVLYCAKKYILNHLMQLCLNYLRENLHISTLWEILAIAEALHEEGLRTPCIKIMCQYPSEVWLSTSAFMNQSTLSRLLDESSSNLTEIELWNLVLLWAQQECEAKDLPITPENKRSVINKSGFFKKIRFLTLTQNEITDLIVPSGLLTEEEVDAINGGIQESGYQKKCNIQNLFGLNSDLNIRSPVLDRSFNHCCRVFLTKRKLYTLGGIIKTEIVCSSRVLIRGLEVFTRIPSNEDYYLGRGNAIEYNESFSLHITDEEGNVINQTSHTSEHCSFNTQQKIMFPKPFWLSPNKKYTIAFDLPDGQYPLYDLSTAAYSKSIYFTFKDLVSFPDSIFCNVKLSFVNSLIFNI